MQYFGNDLDYFGKVLRQRAMVQFSFFRMAVGAIPNSAENVREK